MPALEDVVAAGMRLRSRGARPSTGEELAGELVQLRGAIDALECEFAQLAAAFDESGFWEVAGSASAADWIRHACHTSGVTAHTAVSVGRRAAGLPSSVDAVAHGRIGFGHLSLLARTAEAIDGDAGGRDMGFDEGQLLRLAEQHTVGRFRHDCAHARHAADARGALQQHVDAVEQRYLELRAVDDGFVLVSGRLDGVGGATLRTALEPLARRDGSDDHRHRDRRLADALVELCGHLLDQGVLPRRGGQRPHVQVTTTLETLRGLSGAPAAELEFALPITAATAQRLACDASVVRVLLDARSAVIDVGRARRTPPPSTARALRVRDGGCVWPGCDRPVAWTTAHHVKHWTADHGRTDLGNLVLLCYRHHWRVHEGGWQLIGTGEGVLTVPPLADYAASADVPGARAAPFQRADVEAAAPIAEEECLAT